MKRFILIFAVLILTAVPVYAEEIITAEENGPVMEELYEYFYKSDRPAVISEQITDIPTSNMFYDQLTDIEKPIYNAFKAQINNTLDGVSPVTCNIEINIGKNANVTNTTLFDTIYAAINEQYGIDKQTFLFRGEFAFLHLDHPEYFWIDSKKYQVSYGASYTPSTGIATVKLSYGKSSKITSSAYFLDVFNESPQTVKNEYDAMMTKAKEIIASAPAGSSEWGKLNHYVNWFRDNCEYNSYLKSEQGTDYAYIAPSAFLHGTDGANAPVCEGYSEALKILCDLSGIKAMCAESSTHKWNFIYLDGKYYHCDPTWFDNMGNRIIAYQFMLSGSVNMEKNDQNNSHVITYQKPFQPPTISATDYLNDKGINGYELLNINGDYTIDKRDSITLLRILSGLSSGKTNDVDGNGKTNINDAVKMQKLIYE